MNASETFFGSVALPMVARGIHVVRVAPKEKRAIDDKWQDLATTDPAVVESWALETPACNAGCVAKNDGPVVFFETDEKGVIERFEAETGQKFPVTFAVRSQKDHYHFYYLQNEVSRALGNVKQGKGGISFGSVRQHNQYVLAPNSIHPDTKEPYKLVRDIPMIPFPAVLADWIKSQIVSKAADASTPTKTGERKLIPHGQMHSEIRDEAWRLFKNGHSAEEIYAIIIPWAHTWCVPPVNDKDVLAAAKVGIEKEQGAPAGAAVLSDDPKIVEHKVVVPDFPRLLGPLGRLADALTPDIPYDYKALAIMTCVGLALAGRIHLSSDPWLQPRFYALNVGKPNSGKSAACVEVTKALKDACSYWTEFSVDSGPALVEALSQNPRYLLLPDEMADQFEKAKVTGSGRNSLFGEWLRLFENNTTGNRTKKQKKSGGVTIVNEAYFAMLGGATVERFPAMWQGTGSNKSGMRSRFSIAYSEQEQPRLKTPHNAEALAAAVKEVESLIASVVPKVDPSFYSQVTGDVLPLRTEFPLSLGAQEAIAEWRAGEDSEEYFQRIVDQAKRVALLNAFFDGKADIDREAIEVGLDFADYEIAIHEKLFEPDAANYVQAFENRIIRFFVANPKATSSQVTQAVRPEKHLGGYDSFNRAWTSLWKAKRLAVVGKTRKGCEIYEWQKLEGE